MPKEAAAIAAIQRESWHDQGLADELPGPAQIEQAWREAIATPPLAIYRAVSYTHLARQKYKQLSP